MYAKIVTVKKYSRTSLDLNPRSFGISEMSYATLNTWR